MNLLIVKTYDASLFAVKPKLGEPIALVDDRINVVAASWIPLYSLSNLPLDEVAKLIATNENFYKFSIDALCLLHHVFECTHIFVAKNKLANDMMEIAAHLAITGSVPPIRK